MQLSRCLIFLTITFGISLCDDDPASSDNIVYKTPILNDPSILYFDHFDDVTNFRNKWVKSQGRKKHVDGEAEYDGAWEIEQPSNNPLPGDFGLVMKNKAKHSAISSMLKHPFKFELKPLVVQYEVQFQEGQECGGAYLKLLSDVDDNKNLSQFTDSSLYSIMFGPDKCGNDFKLHFIFKHQNPLTGLFEEKHCKKPEVKLDGFFSDKKPHLYTLILYPDNNFKVLIDHNVVNQGSLLSDFTPQVNPPAEIDDPTDVRPADWDFREKIPDPTAKKADDWDEDAPATIPNPNTVKPEGWLEDEPVHISDPDAEKPSDWDEEMDGEWEAPLIVNPACQDAMGCGKWVAPPIENPNYKGKWIPPLIDNPNYKGEWKPRRIPNPNYFEDNNPFKMTPIMAVGFELWSMSPNILFDNLVITDNEKIAEDIASKTFDFKNAYFNKNDLADSGKTADNTQIFGNESWWWTIYFIYCTIPVAIYVWYIWSRVKEDSFFSTIVSHTKQKPWLWAVYIVLLLVPVVLAVLFCFGATAKDKDLDKDAMRKKTDDPEADDEVMGDSAVLDEKVVPNKGDPEEEMANDPCEDVLEPQEFDSSDEMEEDQEDEASDEKTSPDKKSPHSRRIRAD